MRIRALLPGFMIVAAVTVEAATIQVIRTVPVDSPVHYASVDPIVSPSGDLVGFALCDSVARSIRIERFDLANQVLIPVDQPPLRTASFMRGDSLFLYVLSANQLSLSQRIARYIVTEDTAITDAVLTREFSFPQQLLAYIRSQSLRLEKDETDDLVGVTVTTYIYLETELMFLLTTESPSFVHMYSPDLSDTIFAAQLDAVYRGYFTGKTEPEYIGYYDQDWSTFDEHEQRTVGSGDATYVFGYRSDSISFLDINAGPGTTLGFFAGDFTSTRPFDEFIYCGCCSDLTGQHPAAACHIAMYSLANDSLEQIWYRLPSNVTLYYPYIAGEVIAGTKRDSVAIFINLAHGNRCDSASFGRVLAAPVYFETGQNPSMLNCAGLSHDTLFVYQFDAITGIDDRPTDGLPMSFELNQNYPNPFNATTEIVFSLSRAAHLSLTIYNLLGQEVATLADGRFGVGEHRVSWDGKDRQGNECGSGIYLYRLEGGKVALSRKMVLLK